MRQSRSMTKTSHLSGRSFAALKSKPKRCTRENQKQSFWCISTSRIASRTIGRRSKGWKPPAGRSFRYRRTSPLRQTATRKRYLMAYHTGEHPWSQASDDCDSVFRKTLYLKDDRHSQKGRTPTDRSISVFSMLGRVLHKVLAQRTDGLIRINKQQRAWNTYKFNYARHYRGLWHLTCSTESHKTQRRVWRHL